MSKCMFEPIKSIGNIILTKMYNFSSSGILLKMQTYSIPLGSLTKAGT